MHAKYLLHRKCQVIPFLLGSYFYCPICMYPVCIKLKSPHNKIVRALFSSDSDRIQTCNLLIRSQVHYSVMLRSHNAGANIDIFFKIKL